MRHRILALMGLAALLAPSAAPAAPMSLPAAVGAYRAPVARPAGMVIGVGFGGHPDGCGTTPAAGMRTARVILYSYTPLGLFLDCARQARAAGLRLIVSVQFDAHWSIPQDRSWFRRALAMYGPLHPYAVSVGNEQEINQTTPALYVRVWRAVEPIVRRMVPHAIRVAGEISPWGLPWLAEVVHAGIRGVQALAGHAYPDQGRGFAPGALVGMADTIRVPAWVTEGMCGPGAWLPFGCVPRGALRRSGVALALEWHALPGGPAPASGMSS